MNAAWLNRLILWLSLVGMVLVLHLGVQQARGFDQGCLGLSQPVRVSAAGCEADGLQAASRLLGVPHVAWGYAFYFGLALLSFAKLVMSPAWARRSHHVGEAAVTAALLYSAYLTWYQAFVAEAFCTLCLGSAGLVAALFAAHAWLRLRGGFVPVEDLGRGRELGFACFGLLAAAGVLVGVMLFVNRLGTRPLDQGAQVAEIQRLVGQALPQYIDGDKLREMRACRFEDPELKPVDLAAAIPNNWPYLGSATGVPVVLFYDPQCGNCRHHYRQLPTLLEHHGDDARVVIVPTRLWSASATSVEALHVAAAEGQYFEVWNRFAARGPGDGNGLDLPAVAQVFEAAGLNSAGLSDRLTAVRPVAEAVHVAGRAVGVRGVPAVFIDGIRVAPVNLQPDCLGRLVERRIAARAVGAAANATKSPTP